MPAELRCPSCYQKVGPRDVQCPRCELLLEGQLDQPAPTSKDISIVRGLLEKPQARAHGPKPPPPPAATPTGPLPAAPADEEDIATRTLVLPPELSSTPRVVASLRMTELSLTPFEAYLVSMIDGRTRAGDLRAMLGVSEFELRVMLGTLRDRGVLSFEEVTAPNPIPGPPERPARPHGGASQPATAPSASIPVAQARPATAPSAAIPVAPARPNTPARPATPPRPATAPRAALKPEPPHGGAPQPAAPKPAPVVLAPPSSAPPAAPTEGKTTDPRVTMGEGVAKNRKLLDALKQVKRAEPAKAPPAPEKAEKKEAAPESVRAVDLASESALQVAIRMERDGKLSEAVRYLERAISRSPDAAPLYNRLAIVLVRDKRSFREAERLLQRATELAPENEVYKRNLVSVINQRAKMRA